MAFAGAGCSSTTPAGGNGALSGTLYFHGQRDQSGHSVFKLDFASNAITSLLLCVEPDALPDGRFLCGDLDLAILSADGSQRQVIVPHATLTGSGQYNVFFKNPRMSPDGRYAAYDDDVSTNPTVYVVDAATGALVKKFGNAKDELYSHPSWGPDGSLYFQGNTFNFNHTPGIYKVDNAFTTVTRIDKNLNLPEAPVVSRDGTKIAFLLNRRVWTMKADGSAAAQAASPDLDLSFQVWSPDGKFVVANTGNCDLVALDIAGASFFQLSAKGIALSGSFGTCPDGQMTWR